MAKYALFLNVLCHIEAENEDDAIKQFQNAKPMAHEVNGEDIVYDVEIVGTQFMFSSLNSVTE